MSRKEAIARNLIKAEKSSPAAKCSPAPKSPKTTIKKRTAKLAVALMTIDMKSDGLYISVNDIPVSLNAIVGMHGTDWYRYAKVWKRLVHEALLEAGLKNTCLQKAYPIIYIYRPGKQKHFDLDNVIIKPIIDGLVVGGIYQDDASETFPVSPFTIQGASLTTSVHMQIRFCMHKKDYLNTIADHLNQIEPD